jgi:predicted transcriptional regulator
MSVKEQARMLVEALSEESTWEDLMFEIYVHESIQRGLEDSRAGRTKTTEEIRARFQIPNP